MRAMPDTGRLFTPYFQSAMKYKTLTPHALPALTLPHQGPRIKSSRLPAEISKTMRQNKPSLPPDVSVWYFVTALRKVM